MAKDATSALIAAVGSALLADATVAGAVGTRVYAGWETAGTVFPFLRMSVPTVTDYEHECGEGSEHVFRVHVFARGGPVAAADVASAVRDALDATTLAVTGASLHWFDYTRTNNVTSADDPGVYTAVVEFTAVTTTN